MQLHKYNKTFFSVTGIWHLPVMALDTGHQTKILFAKIIIYNFSASMLNFIKKY